MVILLADGGGSVRRIAGPAIAADQLSMLTSQQRDRILSAYRGHARRFDAIAADRERREGVRRRPSESTAAEARASSRLRGHSLSARELGVLTLISSGFTNSEIGRRLTISEETVKSHTAGILKKLEARNRAHAAAIGVRRGLVQALED